MLRIRRASWGRVGCLSSGSRCSGHSPPCNARDDSYHLTTCDMPIATYSRHAIPFDDISVTLSNSPSAHFVLFCFFLFGAASPVLTTARRFHPFPPNLPGRHLAQDPVMILGHWSKPAISAPISPQQPPHLLRPPHNPLRCADCSWALPS